MSYPSPGLYPSGSLYPGATDSTGQLVAPLTARTATFQKPEPTATFQQAETLIPA